MISRPARTNRAMVGVGTHRGLIVVHEVGQSRKRPSKGAGRAVEGIDVAVAGGAEDQIVDDDRAAGEVRVLPALARLRELAAPAETARFRIEHGQTTDVWIAIRGIADRDDIARRDGREHRRPLPLLDRRDPLGLAGERVDGVDAAARRAREHAAAGRGAEKKAGAIAARGAVGPPAHTRGAVEADDVPVSADDVGAGDRQCGASSGRAEDGIFAGHAGAGAPADARPYGRRWRRLHARATGNRQCRRRRPGLPRAAPGTRQSGSRPGSYA